MRVEGWNVIDADTAVLWQEYAFRGKARATTLVFRGSDGLVVVSPGIGVSARDYDALREFGEVRALVANNSFHHLGQAPWRARFPDAVSYAPSGAREALGKKARDFTYEPLSSLGLLPHTELDEPAGFRSGDTFFRIRTGKGAVWFTSDLLTNIQGLPAPPLRWLFSWTDSAPGFRLFKPGVWFLIRDKKAVRAWALDRLKREPPAIVVPAHGPAFESADVAALAGAQIERL
jgi:glyoxylase-like metal-dependent hydrolase (beta-lactamase superfamily II)